MDRPDYDLEESLDASGAEQHRAFGNLTRHRILGLLLDRAMTVTQLAEALGVLKGSASFHVHVLERAGLVRVVRTRRVRGAVERYYGRTARRFELDPPTGNSGDEGLILRTVADELERAAAAGIGGRDELTTVTRARLEPAQAADFMDRLVALVEEFRLQPGSAGPAYTLAVSFFRSEPATSEDTS